MHIGICLYMRIYRCVGIHVYVEVCADMHVQIYTYIYRYMPICPCVQVYIYIQVYTCKYIQVQTYTSRYMLEHFMYISRICIGGIEKIASPLLNFPYLYLYVCLDRCLCLFGVAFRRKEGGVQKGRGYLIDPSHAKP